MMILTFVLLMLLFVFVGNIAARFSHGTGDDYLLAGRSASWIVVGLSAGAVGCSGFVMTGAVGAGYTMGISAALLPLAFLFGDYLFWKLCAARVNETARELNSFTAPELLSARFRLEPAAALHVRRLAALITVGFVVVYASAQLLAAGKTVSVPFGIAESVSIWLTVALVVSYCAVGGMRSSMSVHSVQSLMILFTVFGSFAAAVVIAGGPLRIVEQLRATAPELLRFESQHGIWMLLTTVLGFLVAGFTHVLSTPQILVRLFSGRAPREAARAMWLYILITEGAWLCMTFFGMTLRALMPDLADPEEGLPRFAQQHLTPWLAGAVLAGMLAALTSTIDSLILVLSSSLTVDMKLKSQQNLERRVGRAYPILSTVLAAILLAIIAINLEGTVFTLVLFAVSAIAGTFSAVMLVVIFRWRTHSTAIIGSMWAGLLAAILWRLAGLNNIMIEALPGLCAGMAAHWLIMRFSPYDTDADDPIASSEPSGSSRDDPAQIIDK